MPNIRLDSVIPKGLPKSRDFVAAIEKAALKTARLAEQDLKATVRTWVHKPDFSVNVLPTDNPYTIVAGTDDPIYNYVDAGTKAHVIRPKRSKYLRWNSGYRAKTRPNILNSREGGASGAAMYATVVHHPGTKARNFLTTMQKRRQKTFEQEISAAIAKVVRGK